LNLLQFVKDRHVCLKDKITKNKVVWKNIALLLQSELPGVTPGQCDQKWRNLQQQWKKYVDNSNKTGRGKMVRPEYFDEIGEIIGQSHTVKPLYVLDTEADAVPSASATDSETSLIDSDKVSSKAKKIKPATTKEKLETKMDLLIAQHVADREQSQKQFEMMMTMLQKQHEDRRKMMKVMVKVFSQKRKAKDSDVELDSDSD